MTSARLALLTVLLAAATAGSAEPDGAVAGPLRWSDPRGAPSGSRRSSALPLTRSPRKLWEFRPEGYPISAPPVAWDGRLYLLGGIAGNQKLFAVDLLTGAVLAKKSIEKGITTRPVVWDHRVFLRTGVDEISVLSPSRRSFKKVWRFKPKLGDLSDPIAFEGEVYTLTRNRMIRLREGRNHPTWSQPVRGLLGRPALYGAHVYALAEQDSRVHLYAFNRTDGYVAAHLSVASVDKSGDRHTAWGCEVTVLEEQVYLRSALPMAASQVSMYNAGVDLRRKGKSIGFGSPARVYGFAASPAALSDGLLALSDEEKELAWVTWRGTKGQVLAGEKEQPDFFRQRLAPTVVGDVAYFGTWAADTETLDVLWRLPHVRLRFPVLPADRMIVVVDDDGGVIAYAD